MIQLATTKQRQVMQRLHIDYDPLTCTVSQARALIMEYNARRGKVDVYSDLSYTRRKELQHLEKLRKESV